MQRSKQKIAELRSVCDGVCTVYVQCSGHGRSVAIAGLGALMRTRLACRTHADVGNPKCWKTSTRLVPVAGCQVHPGIAQWLG